MPDGPYHQRRYLIPFRATLLPQIFTDVLVIGGGVAGLRAGLAAAGDAGGTGIDVIVTAKRELDRSNTWWAQGGIAAVIDEADDTANHVQDTLVAGAGLCDGPAVRSAIMQGPLAIRELIDMGMRFDRVTGGDGDDAEHADDRPIALGKEGGHSHHRILHTDGDATGKALGQTLARAVEQHPHIRLFTDCFVLDLITSEGDPPRVLGAVTHHPKHGLQVIWAAATILATGGCGQVYRESTNPSVATGDGLAMAWRAGAAVQDLAFMQFHPTTLYIAGASRSLITEAVRGEGAHLIDRDGHRFMPDYDARAELAPRDIVSRSIMAQMAKTGHTHVYLDTTPIGHERFTERFPGIAKTLQQFDIDPKAGKIPVQPAAHYYIGGVRVDELGRTNLHGLYAVGEASCTGLHGANRLASNSLLEGLVFGKAVGDTARQQAQANGSQRLKIISDIRPSDRSELDLADVRSSLRSVMWRHVGINREGERLKEVKEMFDFWARYTLDKIFDERLGWEVQNLLTVGSLITRAALWREESRGTHCRLDHEGTRAPFHAHDVWQRGNTQPRLVPVLD